MKKNEKIKIIIVSFLSILTLFVFLNLTESIVNAEDKLEDVTESGATEGGNKGTEIDHTLEGGVCRLNDPPKMVHRSTKLYPLPANQRALLL